MQETIDENLKHPNEEIQYAAVAALKAYTEHSYSHPPKKAALDLVARYIDIVKVFNENAAIRRGYCLALGTPKYLRMKFKFVF